MQNNNNNVSNNDEAQEHGPFYYDLEKKRDYAQGILNKARAPDAKPSQTMSPEEDARSNRIIKMYNRLLGFVEEVEAGNESTIVNAAVLFDEIRRLEGREGASNVANNSQILQNYREALKTNNNRPNKRLEDQINNRCGIHALNHIFQEEKLVCMEDVDSVYIDADTKEEGSSEPMNKDVLLNAPKICEAYEGYTDCDEDDKCEMLPINILQNILTPNAIDPDLPDISLNYNTKGIEFMNDKGDDNSYYSVEVPILAEMMKNILAEPDSIGALLNLNNWHYTAIVNKGGLKGAPAETDFTYLDSMDKPCTFGAAKKPDYLSIMADAKALPAFSSGNYTYDSLPWLIEKLLKRSTQDGNIDVTIVKYKADGSSYFSKSLENILASRAAAEGGKRKSRKNMKKTKRSKTRKTK